MLVCRNLAKAILASMLVTSFVGCGPVVFDESVDGLEIVRDVDDIFFISFPLQGPNPGASLPSPEIRGNAVRFISQQRDERQGRSFYKFEAVSAGESEIVWWRSGGDGRRIRDHYLRVNVRLPNW
ncbi:MAG TPA: hypothetical protein VKU80_07580 [Planctomycetota bacterium]|nr:hypothetical protein [Planctomycetota bacterium]